MNKLFLIIMGFITCNIHAQEYNVDKIASELRQNADVIVRDEKVTISVKSLTKMSENYKIVLTILNKQGDYLNTFSVLYDKNESIESLKAIEYDSLGNKLNDFNKSDFKDQSQISDFSIYEDNRVKYLKLNSNQYPYTIELSYSKDYNSNYFIPGWYPQNDFRVAVENSEYTIIYPIDLNLRFKQSKLSKVQTSVFNDKNVRNYSCKNLPAIDYEQLSAGLQDITPWVKSAPSNFSFENTTGDLSSWRLLGKWVYDLSKDLDKLPPAAASTVHQLTDGVKKPEEKIKILYHYLQSKTRYVSVQLGIGGFQPFSAEKVASSNYGDCKALSNYMKSLLKEINIPSMLVLVKAGDNGHNDLWSDFSSIGQANHMILCVPMAKDSIWLECTSQRQPFNYLGNFTDNRNVLLISEEGGKLVKTPKYSPNFNFQLRKAEIDLSTSGNANCKISTSFGGEQFENIQYQLFQEPKEQKENLYKGLSNSIATPEVTDFKYEQRYLDVPELDETINLKAPNLLTGVGDNLFLTLNLLNRHSYIPPANSNRKTDFMISNSYYDKDELIYHLPKGYKVDFIPQDVDIKTVFGQYKLHIKVEADTILYSREQTMFKNQFLPENFNKLIDFYKAVVKSDKQKAILTKIN